MPDRGRRPAAALAIALLLTAGACSSAPSPSAGPSASPRPTVATAKPSASPTARATATPEPPLSLALPATVDPREVRVTVDPQVPADGDGRIVVTVTSLADTRITELVLRWNTDLQQTLFLAPFEPAEIRLVDGGPPLVQPWTKWVIGPGERGEPAGTTSLGWGPLDAGATLTVPILVTRRANGPVSFDLQLLVGESILTLEGGAPAELRVAVP